MAARAIWKGTMALAELAFPVALYAAATTAQRVAFHVLNRKTGNRVHREYVDEATEKPVPKESQVKGYETAKDQYVVLDPEEIAAAIPEGDKTLRIQSFIPCRDVQTVYFDKPYFIAPADESFADSFSVVREGMRKRSVAALARAVLFRRVRTVLVRAQGPGLIAHTLNFDYEVRSGAEAFADLRDIEVGGEMLDLARHIIETKRGDFDPRAFDDRYDAAVAELIKAKMEGRAIKRPKPRPEKATTSLLDALRESANAAGRPASAPKRKAPAGPRSAGVGPKRKAG